MKERFVLVISTRRRVVKRVIAIYTIRFQPFMVTQKFYGQARTSNAFSTNSSNFLLGTCGLTASSTSVATPHVVAMKSTACATFIVRVANVVYCLPQVLAYFGWMRQHTNSSLVSFLSSSKSKLLKITEMYTRRMSAVGGLSYYRAEN